MKLTPDGRAPTAYRLAAGKPAVVTVKLLAAPGTNVAALPLVTAGASLTRSTSVCTCFAAPFDAVIAMVYVPPVPGAGAPARVAVPSPLSANVSPLGRAPLAVRVSGGVFESAARMKRPARPAVKIGSVVKLTDGRSPTT